ncbi:hypothetical protein HK405_007126, partial [Cladochytrium tenue]
MARAVDFMIKPDVGLVHHIPVGIQPRGIGSYLERAFLNTAHAKMYTVINKVAVASCVVGKSNMLRKSTVERIGGLPQFGKFISEDNIIGQAIWSQGLRHVIPADLAYQRLGRSGAEDYLQRRCRWTRIRKYA